jgi:hypothetical protein
LILYDEPDSWQGCLNCLIMNNAASCYEVEFLCITNSIGSSSGT